MSDQIEGKEKKGKGKKEEGKEKTSRGGGEFDLNAHSVIDTRDPLGIKICLPWNHLTKVKIK